MSGLETIVAKFYDKSGRYIVNLNVKSRYQGSTKENITKTDANGLFIFQASPNRIIEILAKPPNESEFTVFRIRNSSSATSEAHPIKIQLPRTIEEYKQARNASQSRGIVSTFFKVVDSTGKVMSNFPVQSRPKGKNNSPDKYTNKNGIIEILSSPNRDIEVLVLAPNDQFQLKVSMNSGNGTTTPILIKLDHPYSSYKSKTELKILDRDGSDYILKKTNVEMVLLDGSGTKRMLAISNGKTMLYSMVGQNLQFTVFKPDGRALNPVLYTAKRVNEQPLGLRLDVDVMSGTTAQNEPTMSRNLENTDEEIISLSFFKAVYGSGKLFSHKVMNGKPTQNTTPEQFVPALNKSLVKHNMRDKLMLCHFLAQIYHECDHFNTLIEYASGKDYDISNFPPSVCHVKKSRACKRRAQILAEGNTTAGDGPKYKGKGLIQLTWKSAYEKYQKYSGLDVVSNPELLCSDLFHAVESSVWAFNVFKNADSIVRAKYKNDTNTYTDSEHLEVVYSVSKRINGGVNGMVERKKLFLKILREVEVRNGFK